MIEVNVIICCCIKTTNSALVIPVVICNINHIQNRDSKAQICMQLIYGRLFLALLSNQSPGDIKAPAKRRRPIIGFHRLTVGGRLECFVCSRRNIEIELKLK